MNTHIFTLNSSQTFLMAPSPSSCMIRMILSTAMYVEFHRVWFGRINWSLHSSSTISATMYDLPVLFHIAWHLPKAARDSRLYVSVCPSALAASVVAIKFNRWHAHLWWGGSWYSRPLSSSRMLNVSWWLTWGSSSVESWSDSASSDRLCSPNTLNALTKFEPLSVVVLTTFPLILYWQRMASMAPASTSKVWEPLNLWHASAADLLSKVSSSIQWQVTPMKLLWCAVQQSVVVAT